VARAKKEGKPKRNRANLAKNAKRIQATNVILKKLKEQCETTT
jgi:hypothetical protein